MIKKLVTVIVLSILFVSPMTHADNPDFYLTGNDLKEYCESPEPQTRVFCIGYIVGVSDGIDWFDGDGDDDPVFPSCPPTDLTMIQMAEVLLKYLEDTPQFLHLPATPLIAGALVKAFPCPD